MPRDSTPWKDCAVSSPAGAVERWLAWRYLATRQRDGEGERLEHHQNYGRGRERDHEGDGLQGPQPPPAAQPEPGPPAQG